MFIRIIGGKTGPLMCGDKPRDGFEYIDVPEDYCGFEGMDVREFNPDLSVRSLSNRIADGLVVLDPRTKLEGERVIPKTDLELMRDGIIDTPQAHKIEDIDGVLQLVAMSYSERVASGELSQDEADALETEARRAVILSELDEIDKKGNRPARAVALGKGTEKDYEKLAELEEEAEALRVELAGLK